LIDGEAFLEAAGWAGATCVAIPSDASDRRYFRVSLGGETAVLMQAPVATSVPARRQFDAFRRVSGWLRGIGLAAPAELSAEPSAGLLLLEDLGEVAVSRLLDLGTEEARTAYETTVSVIDCVARQEPPGWMHCASVEDMVEMIDLTFSLLPGSEGLAEDLRGVLREHLVEAQDTPVVSMRDVHGDNLIWRGDRTGLARVGLLDFQDALVMPDGYDLASLVDDPRRTVPETWREHLVRTYAARRNQDEGETAIRVDVISVQRNLRILGIFRRLAVEHGRPDYARYLPRTRELLMRCIARAELVRLRPAVTELLAMTAQWEAEAA
jgi:aminoglycoside/choline kinase family phosphotransferase